MKRRWIFWLLVVLFLWVVISRFSEIEKLAETLSGEQWQWVAGSFWGIHLVTLVFESVLFLLPLHQLGFTQARAVFYSRDVGPSAGYMASLGLVTTFLPKPWRWVVFGAVLTFLIVALTLPPRPAETQAVKLTADMAHLIAYPLGWIERVSIQKES